MRRETTTWLTIIEKFFGLLIIILGIIVFYYTQQIRIEGIVFGFFIFFGLVLIASGVFMILAQGK
ncbi:hypothetical protein KAS14_02015 [Candidatus Bathyarchaeota archaeon]|nr:hypothetical protein [Candidatus Bathyarchaeota archaeon]